MDAAQTLPVEELYGKFDATLGKLYQREEISGILLYQIAFDCCNNDFECEPSSGEKLLVRLVNYVTSHCRRIMKELQSADDIVGEYARKWKDFKAAAESLNSCCEYLNRFLKSIEMSKKDEKLDELYSMNVAAVLLNLLE